MQLESIVEEYGDGSQVYLSTSYGNNYVGQALYDGVEQAEGYVVGVWGDSPVILTGPDASSGTWYGPDSPQRVQPRNPFLFGGYYYDAETGLYYARNRYYDPCVGRFLARDLLGMISSPNLYEYCLSNPTKWVDPDGNIVWLPFLIIGAVIIGVSGVAVRIGAGRMEAGLRSGDITLFESGQSWVSWGITGAFVGVSIAALPLAFGASGFWAGAGIAATEGSVFGAVEAGVRSYAGGGDAGEIVNSSIVGGSIGFVAGGLTFGVAMGVGFAVRGVAPRISRALGARTSRGFQRTTASKRLARIIWEDRRTFNASREFFKRWNEWSGNRLFRPRQHRWSMEHAWIKQ